MDREAEWLLRSYTVTRWPALHLLATHAHRHPKKISGSMLTAYLLRRAFSRSIAERFGAEFDRYLDLEARYDQLRT